MTDTSFQNKMKTNIHKKADEYDLKKIFRHELSLSGFGFSSYSSFLSDIGKQGYSIYIKTYIPINCTHKNLFFEDKSNGAISESLFTPFIKVLRYYNIFHIN